MIYQNRQSTFNMTSEWSCYFYVSNGKLQWYIKSQPTTAAASVTFPVSLPHDAVISRAWLEMGVGSPISGTALLTVNGNDAKSGSVELEDISASTTSFTAEFQFRANGIVYQDRQPHSGEMTITDPTLNIQYTSVSSPGDGSTDSETIISRPVYSGVQLPRLLDGDFHEVARIAPVSVQLTLKLNPLSTAVMKTTGDSPEIKVKDFLELFSPHGSAGIFRVTEAETQFGARSGQTIYLEHAFGTLADSMTMGMESISASVSTVIATLLANQNVRHWVLGDCEIPEEYEFVYEHSYDNLLKAITDVTDMLPAEYAWEFDTTRYPFVAHLRKMPDDDACECRLNRNLSTVRLTVDSSNLCTRVYPFGAGEGADRLTLTNLIGSQHMDSPNAETWGYVSRRIMAEDVFDALTLRDIAQRYLDRHDHPTVSVKMDAIDLYEATGETFDKFPLGRVCRVALPAYGVTMRERVIVSEWPDVYHRPEDIRVTLANRIRNASDEIADLLREVTNSKLIGGSVETQEEFSRAGSITPGSPFVQTFDVSGYGTLLNAKISYTCTTSSGTTVKCSIRVDENDVPDTDATVVDITKYLSSDENGVPLVGEHKVRLQPSTLNTVTSTVENTITINQVKKR